MNREEDALIAEKLFGRKLLFIAEEPHKSEPDINAPLGFVSNFGGAHYTADREWLVNDWLDVEANREVPAYTSDPAADYQVLVKCREALDAITLCHVRDEFIRALDRRAWEKSRIGQAPVVYGATQYEPGDWARAYLAAIKAKEPV